MFKKVFLNIMLLPSTNIYKFCIIANCLNNLSLFLPLQTLELILSNLLMKYKTVGKIDVQLLYTNGISIYVENPDNSDYS